MVVSGRELVLREEEGGYRLALTLRGRREVYHLRRKQENVEVLVVAEEGEVLSPSPTAPVELFVDVQRGASLLISWGNSTGVKEQGEEGGVEVRGGAEEDVRRGGGVEVQVRGGAQYTYQCGFTCVKLLNVRMLHRRVLRTSRGNIMLVQPKVYSVGAL